MPLVRLHEHNPREWLSHICTWPSVHPASFHPGMWERSVAVKPPGFSKVQFTTLHSQPFCFSWSSSCNWRDEIGAACVWGRLRERRRSVSLEHLSKNKRNWGGLWLWLSMRRSSYGKSSRNVKCFVCGSNIFFLPYFFVQFLACFPEGASVLLYASGEALCKM